MTGMLAGEDGTLFATLNAIPKVDFPRNLEAAVLAGRRMSSILGEVVALRRGPGKLTPNEFFYYRLWEPGLTRDDKRRFVGKQAQTPMHLACNDAGRYATAADKLLFHALMAGAVLPRPELLAITAAARHVPGATILSGEDDIAAFLRDPARYPLFANPIDGKYSLSVLSARHMTRRRTGSSCKAPSPCRQPLSPRSWRAGRPATCCNGAWRRIRSWPRGSVPGSGRCG